MGGLPGLMCTLSGNERSEQNKIYGPEGLVRFFGRISYLMFRNQVQYSAFELGTKNPEKMLGISKEEFEKLVEDPAIENPNLNLQKILRDYKDRSKINDAQSVIDGAGVYVDKNVRITPIRVDSRDSRRYTLSYLVETSKIPGSLNKDRLNEAKIPKQSMGAFVKTGSYKFEDGREIFLQDFKDPDIPPQLILILDVPDLDSFENLKRSQTIQSIGVKSITEKQVSCIIHLNAWVRDCKEYLAYFEENFGGASAIFCTEAVELDEKIDGSLATQIKLEYLKRHTLTSRMNSYFKHNFPDMGKNGYLRDSKRIPFQQALPYHEFTVVPVKSRSYLPTKLSQSPKQEEALGISEAECSLYEQTIGPQKTEELRIAFLGTGSMLPLMNRTVSAIYIRGRAEDQGILLDCGEGTYHQFMDHFGREVGEHLVRRLRAIIVTHIHLDHNMGILHLLEKRRELFGSENPSPIFLFCPYNMGSLLRGYLEIHPDLLNHTKFIFIQEVIDRSINSNEAFREQYKERLEHRCHESRVDKEYLIEYEHPEEIHILDEIFRGRFRNIAEFEEASEKILSLRSLRLVPVVHCSQSFGLLLEFSDGFSLSYSGDTRPCEQFIELSKNVDLMIHEATFTEEFQENAIQNKHSTVSEAIEVAQKANAKRLILTHFSQRYKRVSINNIDSRLQEYYQNQVVIAVDHLSVSQSQLENLPKISQIYQQLIPENKQ